MIKKYLEHIAFDDDYDPNEIIELVGLPSGLFLETKRKNYSKIQNITNWSERLNTYTFRDENYTKILYLLDLDQDSDNQKSNEESLAKKIKDFGIENAYKIDNNQLIIFGNVKIIHKSFKKFPFKIHKVNGDFDIIHSGLNTLENCPTIITGNFNCSFNLLENLKNGPQTVGLKYNCSHNNLMTLRGCPLDVNDFNCSYNALTNLDYGPSYVSGNFDCSYNQILNLNNSPIIVEGDFNCNSNLLDNLKGLPRGIKNLLTKSNPMRG